MKKILFLLVITVFSLALFADFTENFDGWSDGSYAGVVTYEHTGVGHWENNNAMVHSTYARSGNAVRFNDDSSSTMEYLLFKGLDGNGKDGGIGTISFWYRHWDGNVPSEPIEFIVEYQIGGTAGDWTAIGSSVFPTSTTYVEYSETANISGDDIFFRIRNIQDKERLLIDDMTVTDYSGGASTTPVISGVSHLPTNPTQMDDVVVSATITDEGTITSAKINWGLSTGSLTNEVSMSIDAGDVYAGTIPAQADGATVYYTVSATDNDTNTEESSERNYDVVMPTVATPSISPEGGIFDTAQTVEISCSTAGASIYYTLDGTDPTDASTPYSVALNIDTTTTVKAIAYLTNYHTSSIATELYDFSVAGPADIYISEYIEGSSNNKAIEIYNAGETNVNLGFVEFWRISNGGDWAVEGSGNAVTLSGTLAPGDVYVVCNSSASAEIQALSDLVGTSVCYFNGDDAMGLVYNGTLVDVVGDEGADPGSGWDVAGETDATANHTLLRKTTGAATTDWAASSGTNATDSQWTVMANDDISNLGQPTPPPAANPAPVIANIAHTPETPEATDIVTVTADITDDDGLTSATLNWGLASDAMTNNVAMTLSRATYEADIPAQVGGTTVYYEIVAIDANAEPATTTSSTYDYTVVNIVNVADIATLRTGATDGTIYCLTGEAVLTYQQTYRGQKYVQDATAGILIDDNSGNITTAYNVNDGITGLCGTLSSYGGMLQFIPVSDPGAASNTGLSITPAVVTLADLTANFEMYEAQVVTVNGVTFSDTGSFANGTVYAISDGVNSYNFRTTFYDVEYIGTAIPSESMNITGIMNSRTDGAYISARNIADIVEAPYSDVFISEVCTDLVQYVELYNAGNTAQDLTGWNLIQYAPDMPSPLSGTLNPGEYLVIGAVTEGEMQLMYPMLTGTYFQSVLPIPSLVDGSWLVLDDGVAKGTVDQFGSATSGAIAGTIYERTNKDAGENVSNDWTIVPSPTPGGENENDYQPLPVTLTAFAASTLTVQDDKVVRLEWTVESESAMAGYNIYRAESDSEVDKYQVNGEMINAINQSSTHSYAYDDSDAIEMGTFYYWLESMTIDGISSFYGPISIEITEDGDGPEVPDTQIASRINSIYPNPFNPTTSVSFSLAKAGNVKVTVFNVKGEVVSVIVDKDFPESENNVVTWNGEGVGSGIYFFKVEANGFTAVEKAVMMK